MNRLLRLLPLFATLSLTACGEEEPLRIGFIGGLSGRGADLGESGRNGAMLAVEQRQAAGGINGRALQLVVRDDGQDPAIATGSAQELIDSKVEVIIGPLTSSMAAAIQPVTERAGVLLVSPTVTSMDFYGKDDLLIRLNSTTRDFAGSYARFMAGQPGLRRVSIAFDERNDVFTRSWLAEFNAAFEAQGGSVVAAVPFISSSETAFADVMREMLVPQPDGLLFIANAVDTAQLSQQARKLGGGLPKIAAEWAATESLLELGGAAVEGLMLVQSHDRDDKSERYRAFRKAYTERFQAEPSFASIASYDAATMVLLALERQTGGQSLKQALLGLGAVEGLQTSIDLDANGDVTRKSFFTAIRNNRFVILE